MQLRESLSQNYPTLKQPTFGTQHKLRKVEFVLMKVNLKFLELAVGRVIKN